MKRWLGGLVCVLLLVCMQQGNAQDGDSMLRRKRKPVEVEGKHSPRTALRWSLIPGGGQVYNGQAWKVPIIYGLLAGVGYLIYYNYDKMDTFRDEYLYRVDHGGTPRMQDYAGYPTSNIYSLYNSYNRYFQLYSVIAAGIYALNLLDAYVFGHLYDFQIDDNISMNVLPSVQPSPYGLQPSLAMSLRF